MRGKAAIGGASALVEEGEAVGGRKGEVGEGDVERGGGVALPVSRGESATQDQTSPAPVQPSAKPSPIFGPGSSVSVRPASAHDQRPSLAVKAQSAAPAAGLPAGLCLVRARPDCFSSPALGLRAQDDADRDAGLRDAAAPLGLESQGEGGAGEEGEEHGATGRPPCSPMGRWRRSGRRSARRSCRRWSCSRWSSR